MLTRPELTAADAVRWLDRIEADYATRPRGSTPPRLSNSMRTLRALYLLTDTGIGEHRDAVPRPLPHRDAVKARLVEVLAPVFQHS